MTHDHALTLAIFAITYTVIALGEIPWLRIDRAGAAFAGAVAMVASGALTEAPLRTPSTSTRLRCCSA